ncbi:MAG: hypothetical protein IKZ50_06700 [Bacteroidales bacterium]|nr:hypothetical protein [Bacteroidales bacterium]
MKTLRLILVACLGLILGSCSKDPMIIDWHAIEFMFCATDQNGNDLLDKDYPNNLLDKITFTYNGKSYKYSENSTTGQTKAYLPHFRGLVRMKGSYIKKWYYISDEVPDIYHLYFGELDGAVDRNDVFEIDWGNGTKDVVQFTRKHKGGTKVDDKWTVNGTKFDGRWIKFVK